MYKNGKYLYESNNQLFFAKIYFYISVIDIRVSALFCDLLLNYAEGLGVLLVTKLNHMDILN